MSTWVGQLSESDSESEYGVDDPDAAEALAQAAAVDRFLARLQVAPVRNSRIVDVKYQSPHPRLAADVVNALARVYIDRNLEFKFLSSQEASDWLGQRLAEQRSSVEATEAALQRYREENDAISLEDSQNIVVQELADLNSALTRAKTDRIERESRYRQLAALQGERAALDTFPDILSNAFVQQQKAALAALQREAAQLAENLGDRHPDMLEVRSAIQTVDARIQGEIGNVVQSVRTEYLAAQAQERSLTTAVDEQKAEALAMNRTGIEYGVLRREAESNRQIYESLLQRANETSVSGELRSSNVRIVDEGEVPRSPVAPRRSSNLLLALLGGGMLAVGLAFFFEYLDNRIKTPDELRTHLGLPTLGWLPKIDHKHAGSGYPLITDGVPPEFVEAFRTLRTNVLFSSTEEGARFLMVSSSAPGEGKTVVASNLAISLAQSGQRVLLIDGDLRRGKLHDVFGQKRDPGLSNLLVGNAKASEVVQKSRVPGLWVLSAGRFPPNPTELLGSKRFRDFLGSLGEHFDWVLVDTPPVMAVTDATVVAHEIGGVVFVVGAEMTSRHVISKAIEHFASAKSSPVLGAVLNRVDVARNPYYYSTYYRREYREYYTSRS